MPVGRDSKPHRGPRPANITSDTTPPANGRTNRGSVCGADDRSNSGPSATLPATPIPFTATQKMLAIYPKQGAPVARTDDPSKTYTLFTAGVNAVPPGVPQYVVGGAIGLAQDAKVVSFDWKITVPEDRQ